jgi:hypothetical protein
MAKMKRKRPSDAFVPEKIPELEAAESLAASLRRSIKVFEEQEAQGHWMRIAMKLEREEKGELLDALDGLITVLDRAKRTVKEFGETA